LGLAEVLGLGPVEVIGQARIELEAAPDHLDLVPVGEAVEGCFEATFADIAPGTGDVRPDLDPHDRSNCDLAEVIPPARVRRQTVLPVRRESSLAVRGSEQGLLGGWGQSRGRGVNGRRGLRATASSSAGFGRRGPITRSAQPIAVDEGIDALGEPTTVLLR